MLIHFVDRSAKAKPVDDNRNVRTWCGREIPAHRGTYGLTEVQCSKCREAFSAVLRALPDAP